MVEPLFSGLVWASKVPVGMEEGRDASIRWVPAVLPAFPVFTEVV